MAASIRKCLIAKIILLVVLISVQSAVYAQGINDFKLVYEGAMPENVVLRTTTFDYQYNTFKFIRLPGETQESLIIRDDSGFEIYTFTGNRWESYARISDPIDRENDSKFNNERIWLTGDITNDGQDDIISFYLKGVDIFEFNNNEKSYVKYHKDFPYYTGDALIGDIDNDKGNELVFFGYNERFNDMEGDTRDYYLCIAEMQQETIAITWDDMHSYGFSVSNLVPSGFLVCIADIENNGSNSLCYAGSYSPCWYHVLKWNRWDLEITNTFSMFGGKFVSVIVDGKTQFLDTINSSDMWSDADVKTVLLDLT